jgi:hypothetical protein
VLEQPPVSLLEFALGTCARCPRAREPVETYGSLVHLGPGNLCEPSVLPVLLFSFFFFLFRIKHLAVNRPVEFV